MLLYANASRLITTGDPQAAERTLREAAETFERLGDVRSRAVTMGQIADILSRAGSWTRRCASAASVAAQFPLVAHSGVGCWTQPPAAR